MTSEKTKLSVGAALKETWNFRPYRDLFFIELFSWLAVQVIQYYMCYYFLFIIFYCHSLDRAISLFMQSMFLNLGTNSHTLYSYYW